MDGGEGVSGRWRGRVSVSLLGNLAQVWQGGEGGCVYW